MGSLKPQILHKITEITSLNPKLSYRQRKTSFKCSDRSNNPNQSSTSTIKEKQSYEVTFKTLGSCKLGISRYPDFEYNAQGGFGTGTGTGTKTSINTGESVSVDFDVEKLYIPPLSKATTKFLGIPLPPFLKIEIFPEVFRGEINQESGQVVLEFLARFCFSVGSVYKAPPLLVKTILTSEESKGKMRGGKGQRLKGKDGTCRLVGVATVEPTDNLFMDTFLSLPAECLADLNASISLSSAD